MAKNFLRKIIVDGERYVWYRGHYHLKSYNRSPCAEVLTVFTQHSKKNPLRIHFKEEDNKDRAIEGNSWNVGYPEAGVLWIQDQDRNCGLKVNLNRPKVVATLIQLVRATGWNLMEATAPLTIENGLHLLDEHHEILSRIGEPPDDKTPQDRTYFSVQTGGLYRDEGR